MVMISVGNDAKHCFRLWCFAEVFIRITINVTVFAVAEVGKMSKTAYWILTILFVIWNWRPLYLEIKSLYNSWKWAKHETESDALSELNEKGGKE